MSLHTYMVMSLPFDGWVEYLVTCDLCGPVERFVSVLDDDGIVGMCHAIALAHAAMHDAGAGRASASTKPPMR